MNAFALLLPLTLPFAFSAQEDAAPGAASGADAATDSATDSGRWANWRGPDRNGAARATGLPTTWSTDENILWKTAMPSWSGATPVIWDEHLFLVSPSAPTAEELEATAQAAAQRQGRRRRRGGRNPGGQDMLLLCVSLEDGAIRWQSKLDEGNKLYMKGNGASPSPVTDGTHVWTVTGNGTVSAHDFAGKKVWSMNLQERWGDFGLQWGYASSPVLVEDLLIVQVLHGSHTDEPSYLVAFDGATGEIIWRAERPTDAPRESPDAYTTPLVIERSGEAQIVITGGDYVTGHDIASGEELWRVGGLNPRNAQNYRIVPSAVLCGDVLVAPTRVRPMLGISLSGDGPPTDDSIAWRWNDRGGPDVPTPTTDGTHVFMVDDSGMVTCLNGATGEALWGPERTIQGTVSSSPLLADGKLYVTNEEGITVVLRAGETFEQLAVNELDGSHTLSTPIAIGNRMFLRTGDFLYCIANVGGADGAPEGLGDDLAQAFISGAGWDRLTLADFVNVNGDESTWSDVDGTIVCTGKPMGGARTKKPYKNFELVLEWKHATHAGNSGVFVWCPESAFTDLPPGKLPRSGIEVQVLDLGYEENFLKNKGKHSDWFTSHGDVFPVGASKMKPFRPTVEYTADDGTTYTVSSKNGRSFPSKRLTHPAGEWNHYYIRAINGEVRLWVNGEEVNGGSDCVPSEGYLALEAENALVEYRNIRIRELP